MPYILFDKSEPKFEEMTIELSAQAMRRKVFLAPYHHWYIAYRHTTADLDYTADVIAESLEVVKSKF
jgi:glutamate-1-semialdehyde 2,1-aminomutase/spore coat polysaccharide biosynthesis protein SpsF